MKPAKEKTSGEKPAFAGKSGAKTGPVLFILSIGALVDKYLVYCGGDRVQVDHTHL